MKTEDALKALGETAQTSGGVVMVDRDGKRIVVGKSVQGTLIYAETPEAKLIAIELGEGEDGDATQLPAEPGDGATQLPSEPGEGASQLPAEPPAAEQVPEPPAEPAPKPTTRK